MPTQIDSDYQEAKLCDDCPKASFCQAYYDEIGCIFLEEE